MNTYNLKYQVSLFGIFQEIIPNSENMKFFIEKFSDKNLIPSQYNEISVSIDAKNNENSNNTILQRLRLSTSNNMWDIRINTDRIDINFTNSNIGFVEMPQLESFSEDVIDIIAILNSKFNKKFSRIGVVTQTVVNDINKEKNRNNFLKSDKLFSDKEIVDWSFRDSTKTTIANNEVVNVVRDVRWFKTNKMTMNNIIQSFEGIVYTIDINSLVEIKEFRFDQDLVSKFILETVALENKINIDIKSKLS